MSFRFQGGARRAGRAGGLASASAMALGEAAYLLPWIFAGLVAAASCRAARAARRGDERGLFLLWLAAPPILVFTLTPLWGGRGLAALDDARLVLPLSAAGRLARRRRAISARVRALGVGGAFLPR